MLSDFIYFFQKYLGQTRLAMNKISTHMWALSNWACVLALLAKLNNT
jgi:hypothetical protein